MIVLSVIRK